MRRKTIIVFFLVCILFLLYFFCRKPLYFYYGIAVRKYFLSIHPEINPNKYAYFRGSDGLIYLCIDGVVLKKLFVNFPVDVLNIDHSTINDITDLSNTKLYAISISDCTIGNIPQFHNQSIRSIFFRNSNISSLNSFFEQPLQNIALIDLPDLKDLSPLSQKKIVSLCIKNCKNISSIKGLPSIATIFISLKNVPVKNLNSISQSLDLIALELENTLVEDLSPLKNIKKLHQLNLVGSPAARLLLPSWLKVENEVVGHLELSNLIPMFRSPCLILPRALRIITFPMPTKTSVNSSTAAATSSRNTNTARSGR